MTGTDSTGQNVALLCFYPTRAMEQRVLQRLAETGFDDITPAQARVFSRLDPGGSRVSDLAERALVTKQTVTFMVDGLEAAGYVTRVPDPRDRRARLVRLAERGLRVVEVARSVEVQVEAEWAAHLGPRRMAALREALEALREVTDPYAEDVANGTPGR